MSSSPEAPRPSPAVGTDPGRRWAFLLVVLACLALSIHERTRHGADWTGAAAPNVVEGEPLLTTFDAYRWTRWAREEMEGAYRAGERDPLRAHPWQRIRPDPLPLLPRLLATVAPFTGGSVHRAGFVLVPVLASLFVVPLVLFGVRMGHPAVGVIGAGVGALSSEYFVRTSLGRVDTDALNLFFPWLASTLILFMDGRAGRRRLLALGLALLATLALFELWYGRPAFAIAYGAVALLKLATEGVRPTRATLVGGLLLGGLALALGPWRIDRALAGLVDFASAYLGRGTDSGAEAPALMATVREAARLPPGTILGLLLARPWISAAGLVGFVLLGISRPRAMLPLAPMVALGALSFAGGRRFMIFLAPLVGMGLGFWLSLLIDALRRAPWQSFRGERRGHSAEAVLALVLFWGLLAPLTGRDRAPVPVLPPPVFEGLTALARELPDGARLWSWWDTGYLLTDLTGAATFHDGGARDGERTYFVARSLVDPRMEALPSVAAYVDGLDRKLLRRLRRKHPRPEAAFEEMVRRRRAPADDGLFVLFTSDMIRKFGSIHSIGSWTSAQGAGWVSAFRDHRCRELRRDRIRCDHGDVDLATGRIEGSDRRLRRVVFVSGGRAVRSWDHDPQSPTTLEVFLDEQGRMFAAHLIDEGVFDSGFHRMFVLGQYDPARFEEVRNDFPWLRVFRVRPRRDPGEHRSGTPRATEEIFESGFDGGDAADWSRAFVGARRELRDKPR